MLLDEELYKEIGDTQIECIANLRNARHPGRELNMRTNDVLGNVAYAVLGPYAILEEERFESDLPYAMEDGCIPELGIYVSYDNEFAGNANIGMIFDVAATIAVPFSNGYHVMRYVMDYDE